MNYVDVAWTHDNPNYPVRLVSEIDDRGYEMRKLEFFRDGRVGFASSGKSRLGTTLGVEPVATVGPDKFGCTVFGCRHRST